MGGGGFTMEPDNTVLDEFILGLARRPMPRVCFLPTASGDPLDHITRFYEAFSDLPCEPTDLSLFRLGRRPVDLRRLLHAQDIVYVGGGSMRNMLAIWRVHEPVAGLGLLPGSLSVHYDGEPERRPAYLAAVASGEVPDGFGADDGVGLLFRDGRLERVVSSRPGAGCVRVRRAGDRAVEQPLHVDLLADRARLVA